jgi:DNA-binding MarR family transcriptional regulator
LTGKPAEKTRMAEMTAYKLDDQVGFLLRRAQQRHLAIFSSLMADFTPTQFAAMAKLYETGPLSQNELGRQASMDAATIKGVIDRLRKRGLISTQRDNRDQRRIYLDLSPEGRNQYLERVSKAAEITRRTVSELDDSEHHQLTNLLKKLV